MDTEQPGDEGQTTRKTMKGSNLTIVDNMTSSHSREKFSSKVRLVTSMHLDRLFELARHLLVIRLICMHSQGSLG